MYKHIWDWELNNEVSLIQIVMIVLLCVVL